MLNVEKLFHKYPLKRYFTNSMMGLLIIFSSLGISVNLNLPYSRT
jgi:hypothetical protein